MLRKYKFSCCCSSQKVSLPHVKNSKWTNHYKPFVHFFLIDLILSTYTPFTFKQRHIIFKPPTQQHPSLSQYVLFHCDSDRILKTGPLSVLSYFDIVTEYLVDGMKAKTCVFLRVKNAITAELQCSQFTVTIPISFKNWVFFKYGRIIKISYTSWDIQIIQDYSQVLWQVGEAVFR